MPIVWWVIFLVSVVLYLPLAGYVLPALFFKPGYEIKNSQDFGVKNYKENDGRSVVYRPKHEYQKYIIQYILSEREGKKVILCMLSKDVRCIDYDITVFDCTGRVCKIINVEENIEKPGYTRLTELPESAVYAEIKVNAANNIKIFADRAKPLLSRRNIGFAAAAVLLAILEVFIVKLCFAQLFGDVFIEGFMTSPLSVLITLIIGLAAAAINVIAVIGWMMRRRY